MRVRCYSFYCYLLITQSFTRIASFSLTTTATLSKINNKYIQTSSNLQENQHGQSNGFPLSAKNNNHSNNQGASSKRKKSVEFEIQELRATLEALSRSKIAPRNLTSDKRSEIGGYLRTILESASSPIPLKSLADDDGRVLHGSWRLGFSTSYDNEADGNNNNNNNNLQGLPREAGVLITFFPSNKCDYTLTFTERVLGLDKLIAKSTYEIDSTPLNPGLVTITYQDIQTDMFGMQGMKIGFFGMLKGRNTYLETVWFNEYILVERGFTNEGEEFFNVYGKV